MSYLFTLPKSRNAKFIIIQTAQDGGYGWSILSREQIKNMIATSGKRIAAANRRFSRKKYLQLLVEAMPRIIETPEDLDRANEIVAPFLHPERELAPEVEAFVRLMLKLIEDYNRSNPAFPAMKPHELLRALMEEAGIRQADLLDIFGSRSRVSEAVNGKRTISKQQARRLGERFCISPAAFVEI